MNFRKILLKIKQALWRICVYIFWVILVGAFIAAVLWGNDYMRSMYPTIPWWLIPLDSAAVIVFFWGIIWERKRELDTLKYEFIAVVTHKFRTPLTRIRWSLELLKGKQTDTQAELAVSDISYASESLVELTDTLVDLANTTKMQYVYDLERLDVAQKVRSIITAFSNRFAEKRIQVSVSCQFPEVTVLADARRLSFAIQILIENAIAYTPPGGTVSVLIGKGSKTGFVSVNDSGIGISKEDMGLMFTRFWRSSNAKKMDTEGMGIGLYMANQITKRHGGSLNISSKGEGSGSTFTINVPLA